MGISPEDFAAAHTWLSAAHEHGLAVSFVVTTSYFCRNIQMYVDGQRGYCVRFLGL